MQRQQGKMEKVRENQRFKTEVEGNDSNFLVSSEISDKTLDNSYKTSKIECENPQSTQTSAFISENVNVERSPSASPADDKHPGNLLNDVIAMHMTDRDDDYTPTLAISDVFSNSTDNLSDNKPSHGSKEDQNKEEFLIIDLDTCQMEKGSNIQSGKEPKSKGEDCKQISIQPEGLVSINLSDESPTDFLGRGQNDSKTDGCNFIHKSHENKKVIEKPITCNQATGLGVDRAVQELLQTDDENPHLGFQNSYNDLNSSVSENLYSPSSSCCHSQDLDMSVQSIHDKEEPGLSFSTSELYNRLDEHRKDRNSDQQMFDLAEFPTLDANDNCDYYNCDTHDEPSRHSSQFSDIYEPHPNVPYCHLENRYLHQMPSSTENRDISSSYGAMCYPDIKTIHKNTVAHDTNVVHLSRYSSVQQNSSPFFPSPYLSSYHPSYPYNLQHAVDNSLQFPTASNYGDWTTWNDPTIYEVNLDSQQSQDSWSINNNLNDSQTDAKSNLTDNDDSEATEDADETEVTFLDSSTEQTAWENLSTISVMSGSCYSENSSLMAPTSPSNFTPPPSTSNTPIPMSHFDMNSFEDCRYDDPLTNDKELLNLYSYKGDNDSIMQNLLTYGKYPNAKHPYPSMADVHNSRSGIPIPTSKLQDNLYTNYRMSHSNQIQSDAISTSTRNVYGLKWNPEFNKNGSDYPDSFEVAKQEDSECTFQARRLRHNEPLNQTAIRIMSQWYEHNLDNPYPTKEEKARMAADGCITITQVKSWFANKRNRTNNTKPKVQKRAMKEKLKKLFQDLKHSSADSVENSHIIQQLSGLIQT